jgi:hypothetical protein
VGLKLIAVSISNMSNGTVWSLVKSRGERK